MNGFNLTLLAGVLARLVGLVWPGRRGALLVLAGIALYTLFVGASASVVRAALMGSVTLLAVQFRRQALALNSLAAAVLLMLLLNPRTLWDLGFQLSALATLGILLFVPWLQGLAGGAAARLNPTLAPSWVRALARFGKENVVVTLAAQLTTTPLLVFTFHQFSLVGLLTNLLVLPVQPLVMIAGGLATLAGLVWLPLGHLVAWFAWAFTQWTIVIVQWTASLPYAAVDLGPVDWPVLALYALLLLALWQWPWVRAHLSPDLLNRAFARPALILLPCAAALFVLLAALATQPDGQTHVEFLALDAGDATFLRTPAGARALVDAGSAPSQVLAALGTRLPFWERRLDLLVLTANDDAHLNGATAVLERYDVGLVVAPAPPDKRSTAFSEWRALLRQKNIPTQTLQDGLALDLDGLRLLVLCAGENDAAPMIQVTAGSRTFLLADALSKKQVEAWDKRDAPEARLLPVHVLVPPPQVTPAFLARVAPESVVLFVGRATRTQPSAALLQTLGDLPLYRTDLHGTVEITTDGERLAIRTEK